MAGGSPFLSEDEIAQVRLIVKSFPPTSRLHRYFTALLAERDALTASLRELVAAIMAWEQWGAYCAADNRFDAALAQARTLLEARGE